MEMEAYVAWCSLNRALERLKDSSVFSGEIMEFLEKTVRDIKYDLSGQMRDAILEMEDVLESHISNNFFSSQSEHVPFQSPFIVDLEELKKDVDSFSETIHKMMREDSGGSNDDDDDDDLRSRVDFGGSLSDQYLGLSDQFTEIKDFILHKHKFTEIKDLLQHKDYFVDIWLWGMAGIGKTALANKLFHDPDISSIYQYKAFVTVGQKYQFERVLEDIQKQVMDDPEVDGGYTLIVLDDLWDRNLPEKLFCSNHIQTSDRVVNILSCSRLQPYQWKRFKILRFMDKNESWDLLCHKLFDKTPCPPQLEKAGRKIAEKCQGLPLTIVTVADIMSKADDKTSEEYWNKVATEKRNPVFVKAYDQMFAVLYRSYNHLHHSYKPSFLYLAVFPQNDEIPHSKVMRLLLVEGFYYDHLYHELSKHSVILVHKKNVVVKTCSLHSSFWHMCTKEAAKIKLFHAVDSPDDLVEEDVKSHRRLCIRDNTVLAFEDVHNSMASISKLRSLLCTGPYHQYPVPIHLCLEYFRLLRILEALAIRFYEFPLEALMKLVHLRYLSLTYDGNLAASIFKLYNLHYLIVHRHHNIIEAVGKTSYLPMEIWLMKELKYLHIMGGNLPDPLLAGPRLPNLKTLLDVRPESCTKDVFECMPNLENLGIRIELAPDSNDEPLCFFDHISHLLNLETLKCTIVNPKIMSPPPPLPIFHHEYLKKLTLSGFGYPWEDMWKIAQLPNLMVLKLKCYAFRGQKWELRANDFPCLEYLLIEDSDLVEMTFSHDECLSFLQQLSIKHCYKLQKIPLQFGRYFEKIELVECNSVALACANKIIEWHNRRCCPDPLVLDVHSTWDI